MQAGRLDRRVTIRRAVASVNEMNENVPLWTNLATVWASVVPVKDGEQYARGETLSSKLSRFTIRYSSMVADVDPRDRLIYEGREYEIHGVKEVDRRVGLEITAAARAETP